MNNLLSCPTDCDTGIELGALPVEQNCISYDLQLSEVSDLFILPDGATDFLASWAGGTPTQVSGAIDNTNTDNTKAKHLVGIGDVPEYAADSIDYPKGQSKEGTKTYTLNFTYYQMDNVSYATLRALQCGWTGFKFRYADRAGHIYGVAAGGLVPASVKVTFPKGRGNTSYNVAQITITWQADGDPERRPNPIA